MIEGVFAILLVFGAFAGAAGVLSDEWDQLRCSVLTFEAGHQRLVGDERSRGERWLARAGKQPVVEVTEDEETVMAEGRCGRARESITFVRLEAAKW